MHAYMRADMLAYRHKTLSMHAYVRADMLAYRHTTLSGKRERERGREKTNPCHKIARRTEQGATR
eukprot:799352-Pyramimonas_sp.AAC.1